MSHTPDAPLSHVDTPPAPAPEAPFAKPVINAAAAKRANASVMGMILALLCTVAIVLPILWLTDPQKTGGYMASVDVAGTSQQAAPVAGFTPAVPVLPKGWTVNYARWNSAGSDGVAYWDVGYVSPAGDFISMKQTVMANPTWLATVAENAPVTGERTVSGKNWQLRDNPTADKSLILADDGTTLVLTGSAQLPEFDVLAKATTTFVATAPKAGAAAGSLSNGSTGTGSTGNSSETATPIP